MEWINHRNAEGGTGANGGNGAAGPGQRRETGEICGLDSIRVSLLRRLSQSGLGAIASVASVSSCAKSVFRVFRVFRGDYSGIGLDRKGCPRKDTKGTRKMAEANAGLTTEHTKYTVGSQVAQESMERTERRGRAIEPDNADRASIGEP
jgi:hypothetical protein